ncbi:MAG TPA: anaerobic ribonucleoside-triphosphate reductase activating protein [Candidatus Aenigmarchaeota archaeon]|nr:anaerobic ribonucleoside-triphosphate reductase activating protein [Candidatus Aenigmarchaeota archaeon]
MKIEIGGFQKQSFIDYPKKISSIIFTIGCNFRCPYCHNSNLLYAEKIKNISELKILSYLQNNKKYIDGVVITGGEPTLHRDLPEFIAKVKSFGYSVKLDTNGTNPEMLRKLIKEGLLDFIAMDIKAPLEFQKYNKATGGMLTEKLFENVKKSIHIIINSGVDYEFRTTLVPTILAKKDVVKICSFIKNANLFCLQKFNPENALNKEFRKLRPFEENEVNSIIEECLPYIRNIIYR